jgi:hypothetical protein
VVGIRRDVYHDPPDAALRAGMGRGRLQNGRGKTELVVFHGWFLVEVGLSGPTDSPERPSYDPQISSANAQQKPRLPIMIAASNGVFSVIAHFQRATRK